eukprot:365228-Chlamydomonas_euryale.AAC.38
MAAPCLMRACAQPQAKLAKLADMWVYAATGTPRHANNGRLQPKRSTEATRSSHQCGTRLSRVANHAVDTSRGTYVHAQVEWYRAQCTRRLSGTGHSVCTG